MVTIRNLEKKDASQVTLLIPQLTKNIIEPEKLVTRIKKLPDQKNVQYVVAEINGHVVGCGGLAWYQIPSKGLIGWVEELVVDAGHRNQGIGQALVKKILDIAEQKKVRQVKLTASSGTNVFYEKLGFLKKDQDYFIKIL